MALDIVYGYQGKDHVRASQLGRLLEGTIGGGRYVLETQDQLQATMQTANLVRIGTGDLVMDNRYITNESYQELTVESGQSGYNRNDLVVAKYSRASGSDVDHSVETVELAVIKGTPTTGAAADPSYTAGDIAAKDAAAVYPLWRLPITGLNVGTPVQLFEVLPSYSAFRDSVSQSIQLISVTAVDSASHPSYVKRGGWVQLRGRIKSSAMNSKVCNLTSIIDPDEIPPQGVNRNFCCFAIGAYGPNGTHEAIAANLFMGSDGILTCGAYCTSCDLSGVILRAKG